MPRGFATHPRAPPPPLAPANQQAALHHSRGLIRSAACGYRRTAVHCASTSMSGYATARCRSSRSPQLVAEHLASHPSKRGVPNRALAELGEAG